MAEQVEAQVSLTKVEVAATLAALRAVMDSAPGGPPVALTTAASKFEAALTDLNAEELADAH